MNANLEGKWFAGRSANDGHLYQLREGNVKGFNGGFRPALARLPVQYAYTFADSINVSLIHDRLYAAGLVPATLSAVCTGSAIQIASAVFVSSSSIEYYANSSWT